MSRLLMKLMQPVWRLRRGLTLGARGCVIDPQGRLLLIRHGYAAGWQFPGGGVEWGETIGQALERELMEETGVVVEGAPQLHGVFANFASFPGDHVAFFVVRHWRRPSVPKPNAEIAAAEFFAPGALPEGTTPGTRRRAAEIAGGAEIAAQW